jgi:hypothetical protein
MILKDIHVKSRETFCRFTYCKSIKKLRSRETSNSGDSSYVHGKVGRLLVDFTALKEDLKKFEVGRLLRAGAFEIKVNNSFYKITY